jgi:crossover junction endodeoxyribonuclease RusA
MADEPEWLVLARKNGLVISERKCGAVLPPSPAIAPAKAQGKRKTATKEVGNGSLFLVLPWPPSVNTYYRNIQGRTLISKRGRKYVKDVKRIVELAGSPRMEPGRYSVTIELYPPDVRKRDIDNAAKAILDSLTKSGVWEDDSLVDCLTLNRMPTRKHGAAMITIEDLP